MEDNAVFDAVNLTLGSRFTASDLQSIGSRTSRSLCKTLLGSLERSSGASEASRH